MSIKITDDYVLRYILSCKNEAKTAKHDRMELNRDNFDMYQLRHNFEHKTEGQSKEILSKTRNATEQIKSFFQQALADLDDWWRITTRDSSEGANLLVRPHELYRLTNYFLKKSDYFGHIGNSVQLGLLGSLSISKVTGCLKPKPRFVARKEGKGKNYKKHVVVIEDKTWELAFENIRQEDYYPDPHAELYAIEECELDLSVVRALAEGEDAIYDMEKVKNLKPWGNADLQEHKEARETGKNVAIPSMRPRVRLTEFWGDIVDENTGEMLAENVVVTIANEDTIIRKPTPNPLWHQRTPIIAAALIEVANSPWGIALMDAGTKHNRSLIEIFNLILDSAMKSVWGINQIRVSALDDPKQLTDGIKWGTNLKVNESLPVGAKVLEPVVTGEVRPEVLNIYNLLTQETLTSMMTNDLRMGAQSSRSVKATEVVASENAITSVFQGMAKNFEEKFIQPELELATYAVAQNWDLIDEEIFKSLFGAERGAELAAIEPQDVFVNVINGYKFEVFGISLTLRRQADFRKWTTLLQTIGASEVLIEAFLAQYSFEKYLGEIMTALDIDKSKIANEQAATNQTPPMQETMEQPGAGGAPDMMSQVPGAEGVPAGGGPGGDALAAAFGGMGMGMPSSQAVR